jgi:hypothetical protein
MQELRDLRNPLFVPDQEFIRFDMNALSEDCPPASLSSKEGPRCHSLERLHLRQTEFPIPRLVTGLPWRYAKDTTTPVVPDPSFVPFELRYIARR